MQRVAVTSGRALPVAFRAGVAAVALSVVFAPAAFANPSPNARPQGGAVIGGDAAIAQTSTVTSVLQQSQRAIVDWKSFRLGSNQTVSVQAPNAAAVTLMIVSGAAADVAGKITSNGQLLLVDKAGLLFEPGSQVNATGLVISAPATNTRAFMSGSGIKFNGPAGTNAQVANFGTIAVPEGGLVTMLAPAVSNRGVLTARLGKVILGAARAATVTLYADRLAGASVTGKIQSVPEGAKALLTQTGTIAADGGVIHLIANATDGLLQTPLSLGGTISSRTIGARTGKVLITDAGGSLKAKGVISALGIDPGTKGGQVELLSDHDVTLGPAAKIDVSGQAGGGTAAVGTTLQRAHAGPSVAGQESLNVMVASGAAVSANATTKGAGGHISVLATSDTNFAGSAAARGGPNGGNGGQVEISAGGVLSLSGSVDVSAPAGEPGRILLDPRVLILCGHVHPPLHNEQTWPPRMRCP